MTSCSSTAVFYGTYCRGKRGQRSTCLFQMTSQKFLRTQSSDDRFTRHSPSRAKERERPERGPMERKSGCRTSSSRTLRASNACYTDRRFCDRTHGPYFAKFLGVPRKISSYSGKYSRNKFPEEPCLRTVRKRRTVSHIISYV